MLREPNSVAPRLDTLSFFVMVFRMGLRGNEGTRRMAESTVAEGNPENIL